MSRNSKYWEKRSNEIAELQFSKADEIEKELTKQYKTAERYIQERINLYYARYSKEYGVTLADSKKLLTNDELEKFKVSLEEFKQMAENNIDGEWNQLLDEIYIRTRISRLEALKTEVNSKINELSINQEKTIKRHLKDVYTDTYCRTMFELEKDSGFGFDFAGVNDNIIEKAIYTKWTSDDNFAGRILDNKKNLIDNLNKIITQGLIIGSSSDEMVKKLIKATGVSQNRAIKLIQTETTFIIGRANTDMYKKFGVEEYEIIETLDSSTCETCQLMDEKRFKVSEKQEGLNAPPFHTCCRGTTAPVSKYEKIWGKGDRIARDEEGNTFYKTNVGNVSYEEYIENKLKKHANNVNVLDEEEIQALRRYVSSDSYKINEKLRKNMPLDRNDKIFEYYLDSALEKCNNYNGNIVRTMEINDIDELEEFIKQNKVGESIISRSYLSFSNIENYNENANVLIYVKSKNGKDIRSFNQLESEIVYRRNSVFRVKNIVKQDDKYYILWSEVDE